MQYGLRKSRKERHRRKLKAALANEMRDITIHDAELVDGDIVTQRHAPPDYHRGLGICAGDDFDNNDMLGEIGFVRDAPGMAMSVSLDDAMIVEHLKNENQHQQQKLITTAASSRLHDVVSSTTSFDQPYANLKPNAKNTRNGKKANDYYDYV